MSAKINKQVRSSDLCYF